MFTDGAPQAAEGYVCLGNVSSQQHALTLTRNTASAGRVNVHLGGIA